MRLCPNYTHAAIRFLPIAGIFYFIDLYGDQSLLDISGPEMTSKIWKYYPVKEDDAADFDDFGGIKWWYWKSVSRIN